jgi:hypothetical protein
MRSGRQPARSSDAATLRILGFWFTALACVQAIAQGVPAAPLHSISPGAAWIGRSPAGLIAPPWGCAPGQSDCIGRAELRLILERQRRFELLKQDASGVQPAPVSGIWQVPQARNLPPPTPESQIQPAYRDSSVVRPEFRDVGMPISPP